MHVCVCVLIQVEVYECAYVSMYDMPQIFNYGQYYLRSKAAIYVCTYVHTQLTLHCSL